MIKIYGHKIATSLEVAKIIFWALNFRGEEEGNGYLLSVKTESRPSRQFQSCKTDKYIHEVNQHWGPGPLPTLCVQGSVTSTLQFTGHDLWALCSYRVLDDTLLQQYTHGKPIISLIKKKSLSPRRRQLNTNWSAQNDVRVQTQGRSWGLRRDCAYTNLKYE